MQNSKQNAFQMYSHSHGFDDKPWASPVSESRGKLVWVPGFCTDSAATLFAAAIHCVSSASGFRAIKCAKAPIKASPAPWK